MKHITIQHYRSSININGVILVDESATYIAATTGVIFEFV